MTLMPYLPYIMIAVGVAAGYLLGHYHTIVSAWNTVSNDIGTIKSDIAAIKTHIATTVANVA